MVHNILYITTIVLQHDYIAFSDTLVQFGQPQRQQSKYVR